jgi:regulator of protease activity HflC (stomatin/prohibitin superfamily)
VSAKTLEWSDPDLVTKDKQPIGLQVGVTFARMRDRESVESMWNLYRGEAQNDELLKQQVLNRIPRIAKAVTAEYTLDQMLGVSEEAGFGREVVTQDLFELLETELKEVYVSLLDVGINNIAPSEDFLKLLEEKANAQVAVEVARSQTAKLNEQLRQEQAQTEIDIEKARRQNLVNEELAKVYEGSAAYYELEKLRLLKDIVGDNDKFWFVPEGSSLTLFLTTEAGQNIVPVQPTE